MAADRTQTGDRGAQKAPGSGSGVCERYWSPALDVVPDPIMLVDSNCRIVRVNPEMARRLGRPAEECAGLTCYQAVHGTEAPPDSCPHARTIRELRSCTAEAHSDCLGGTFEITTSPLLDDEGRLVASVHVARDVTDGKRANDRLRLTQFCVDRMSDGAFWMGPDAKFIYVNEAACRRLGYSRDELLSMTVHDIDPDFPKEAWSDHWEQVRRDGSFAMESHHRAKDGRVFPVEITVNFVAFEGREYNFAFARDITDRKRAERDLREAFERFRRIMDGLDSLVYVADMRSHEVLFVNSRSLEVFGEALGRPCWQVFQRGQGQACDFCTNDKLLDSSGQPAGVHVWEFQNTANGRWYECHDQAIPWVDGRLVRLEIATDVTERHQAEQQRRALEGHLQQMKKLESLGVLAGGIAHDFNNLLTGILGNAELAMMDIPPSSELGPYLRSIQDSAARAADLTRQMLAYSGKGRFVVEDVDLTGLIREMRHVIELSVSREAELEYDLAERLPRIEADAGQMRQIVTNLISNASEAVEDGGGTITLRTGVRECDQAYLARTFLRKELPEGSYVSLVVADTGAGMDEQTLARVFEPFFTTKFTGRGLGLAAVMGIVRGHGGGIRMQSAPGRGTTVEVLLPAKGTHAPPKT